MVEVSVNVSVKKHHICGKDYIWNSVVQLQKWKILSKYYG